MPTGERERVEVTAKDIRGNSALHYAAANGLRRCVEYLVAHGADLYMENVDGMTACDLAVRENHHDIALFLESRMIFNSAVSPSEAASTGFEVVTTSAEESTTCATVASNGLLRSQDLQEAKEQLIVEMADTLSVSMPNAESLLMVNDWSSKALLENIRRDPVETCSRAGLQGPTTAFVGTYIILLPRASYILLLS